MKWHDHDDELDRFLREALRIQSDGKDEPITEEELKSIALRCGFSDGEWNRLCEELRNHVTRGRQFLDFENAEDAVDELEKAAALAPYRADILADCGKAHALLWERRKVKHSRQRALDLFSRALEIDAGNETAARGVSDLKNVTSRRPATRPLATAILASALAAGVAVGAAIWFLPSPDPQPPALPESRITELPVSTTETETGKTNIPDGAMIFGDRAFLIVLEDIPWHEAKKRCEEMGGRLAMIKDQETLDFIRKKKKMKRLWLGATDEHKEGDWRWIDGSPVTFDAWSARQPFNMLGKEHYMEIGPAGGFNDVAEEGPTQKFRINGFICEWDLTPETEVQSVGMTVGAAPIQHAEN